MRWSNMFCVPPAAQAFTSERATKRSASHVRQAAMRIYRAPESAPLAPLAATQAPSAQQVAMPAYRANSAILHARKARLIIVSAALLARSRKRAASSSAMTRSARLTFEITKKRSAPVEAARMRSDARTASSSMSRATGTTGSAFNIPSPSTLAVARKLDINSPRTKSWTSFRSSIGAR